MHQFLLYIFLLITFQTESGEVKSNDPNQYSLQNVIKWSNPQKLIEKNNVNGGRVTNSGHQIFSPQLSADGKFISFERLKLESRNLFIYDLTTKKEKQITIKKTLFVAASSFESELCFNPNIQFSKWFVFISGSGSDYNIYLQNIDRLFAGTPPINLNCNSKALDYQPMFSPDGKSIIFISKKGRTSGADLYFQPNIDKLFENDKYQLKGPYRLTKSKSGIMYPCWSPDGRFISFSAEENDGTQENPKINYGIMNIDFLGIKSIVKDGVFDLSDNKFVYRITKHLPNSHEIAPSWSPDGNYIAYYTTEIKEKVADFSVKTEKDKIKSNLGLIKVNRDGGNINFVNYKMKPYVVSNILDPNRDSFLRGPEWLANSKGIVFVLDNPELFNPIGYYDVERDGIGYTDQTKMNSDISTFKFNSKENIILFSAHDDQTTNIFKVSLEL